MRYPLEKWPTRRANRFSTPTSANENILAGFISTSEYISSAVCHEFGRQVNAA